MNYYLSFSDLILVDGFMEGYGKGGHEAVKTFLHAAGMDTTQKIERSYVQHRNLQNKIVTCDRYCGTERLDSAWIKSGAASMDAIILSTGDESMIEELKRMSKEGTVDKAFDGGALNENLGE